MEQLTRQKGSSKEWQKERKHRLNSSKFGKLCKRKKEIDDAYLKDQINPRDLSMDASIRIKRESEINGLKAYEEFKKDEGYPVRILPVGVIINPGCPILATTSDGKL
jgi:hypothetical protein